MKCPKCQSEQVHTYDNEPLDNHSAGRAAIPIDCEIYAEALCDNCEHKFNIRGIITWEQPILQHPLKHAECIKNEFEVEGFDNVKYAGFYQENNRWNGWMQPYFTREVTEKIISDLLENDEPKEYEGTHFDGDNLIMHKKTYSAEGPEIIEPIQIVVDGDVITAYPMGLGWCWYEYVETGAELNYAEFLQSMEAFKNAAIKLEAVWSELNHDQNIHLSKMYPFTQSFDKLITPIIEWENHAKNYK